VAALRSHTRGLLVFRLDTLGALNMLLVHLPEGPELLDSFMLGEGSGHDSGEHTMLIYRVGATAASAYSTFVTVS
jgi:hypothetical protein